MTEHRPARTWPLLLLALPAFVAIWSGWVGLGTLTGFGVIQPLPGIPGVDQLHIDTRITLPIGVETYAAYALRVWLAGTANDRARAFARWSAIGSLALGGAGQIAYHLMVAAHITAAPWQITALVACLPVAVLGMGVALAHLQSAPQSPAPVVQQSAPGPGPALGEVVQLVEDAHRAAAAMQRTPALTLSVGDAPGAPVEQPTAPPAPGEPTRRAVRDLLAAEPYLSQREVARRLGISATTVGRAMQQLNQPATGEA